MLRRLRPRRSVWAAIAAGIVMAPALFGGVAAAPGDPADALALATPGPAEPPSDPGEPLPPDPVDLETVRVLAQAEAIADLAPERYRSMVIEIANRHGVDPRLVASVITVETDWEADAVGAAGEKGLMQIMAGTGAWLADLAGLEEYDLADPETSVHLGTFYLSLLLKEHGRVEKALAAYNGGPRAVAGWRTNIYVRKVLKFYNRRPQSAIPAHGPLTLQQTAS